MKKNYILYILFLTGIVSACQKKDSSTEILNRVIGSIDTIETIYYKQDMARTNPRSITDTIYRFREMYFKRLPGDSIVGVKGHWYMYINDKENVVFEDIYDGERLIRKNNRDNMARVYDLVKYSGFRNQHFWSHNTPFAMQYELKYILSHPEFYQIQRLRDTILDRHSCYQITIILEDNTSMPGFAIKPEFSEGNISITTYYIDKEIYYPIGMTGINYSREDPEQKIFIDQRYYDIVYNKSINEEVEFNTSSEVTRGFKVQEMRP